MLSLKKMFQSFALSNDKASSLTTCMSNKTCSDKLFVSANNYSGNKNNFFCVRYGNVMGSRGSVTKFIDLKNKINLF